VQFVLPASPNTGKAFFDEHIFRERKTFSAIQVIEGRSWDAIAHADLALAASGTVTVECALLGTPLVTFYKVSKLSWYLGKLLVRVPFYSMVNLIAGRRLAPELMQSECTAGRLAAEARHLLDDAGAREAMRSGLAEVRAELQSDRDPIAAAADEVMQILAVVEANGATS
jgi:lipid-A-disaccharide synthase